MRTRLGILALLVGLLALPATPVAAANADDPGPFDAIVVMSETEFQAILDADLLAGYTVLRPAELGWDEAVLGDLGRFGAETVLAPRLLGQGARDRVLVPGGATTLAQVIGATGVVPGGPGGPVVVVRPFRPPLPPVFPFPPPVRIAVVPVPVAVPPVVLAAPPPLPPPPPFPPPVGGPPLARPPGSGVPIIPEADTVVLVVGGLAAVGALAGLRRLRHRPT
jgi:hypothetical protein